MVTQICFSDRLTYWPNVDIHPQRASTFRKSAPSLQPTLHGDRNRSSPVLAADAKVSRRGLIYTQHRARLSLAAALSLASNDLHHLLPVTDIFSPHHIHSAVRVSANKAKSSAAWCGPVRESDEKSHREKCRGRRSQRDDNTEDALLHFPSWLCRFMQPH